MNDTDSLNNLLDNLTAHGAAGDPQTEPDGCLSETKQSLFCIWESVLPGKLGVSRTAIRKKRADFQQALHWEFVDNRVAWSEEGARQLAQAFLPPTQENTQGGGSPVEDEAIKTAAEESHQSEPVLLTVKKFAPNPRLVLCTFGETQQLCRVRVRHSSDVKVGWEILCRHLHGDLYTHLPQRRGINPLLKR
jgi:hypothetical protein